MNILEAPMRDDRDVSFAQALGNVFERRDIYHVATDIRFLPLEIERLPMIGYVVYAVARLDDEATEVAIECGSLFHALDSGEITMVEPDRD